MALITTIHASIGGEYERATDRSKATYKLPGSDPIVLGNGTGAWKADLAFDDERQLTTGATENLDLAGVLADAFGQVLTMARLKAIEIEADKANTTLLTIGNVTNGAVLFFGASAHTIVLAAGERFVIASPTGWVITGATGDLLKVANAAGATATYRIKLVGASA